MIIESKVITDLHIHSIDDLYKLKPLLQEGILKVNKSLIGREIQGQTGQSLCHGLCRIRMRVLRVVDLKFIICICDFGLQCFFKNRECRNETVTYQGYKSSASSSLYT